MKQPPILKKHDVIEMIAPSFGVADPFYAARYGAARRHFEKLGYRVKEGKNIHLAEGVVASASPEARAEEFLTACQDDSALILSVGGGELMDEILPFIPFSDMHDLKPKWFMGFSDNTNLTYPLTTLLDWITIYGPNAPSFYEWPMRLNQADALRPGVDSRLSLRQGYAHQQHAHKQHTNDLLHLRYPPSVDHQSTGCPDPLSRGHSVRSF